jgi:hypothetical protein
MDSESWPLESPVARRDLRYRPGDGVIRKQRYRHVTTATPKPSSFSVASGTSRVAAGPEQTLDTGSAKRSFLDFGAHGDRLVLRVGHATALGLLLDRSTLW